MSVSRTLTRNWELIPLAGTMVFAIGLCGWKMYDKVANDLNINLKTHQADVGDWEMREKLNTPAHIEAIKAKSVFRQRG